MQYAWITLVKFRMLNYNMRAIWFIYKVRQHWQTDNHAYCCYDSNIIYFINNIVINYMKTKHVQDTNRKIKNGWHLHNQLEVFSCWSPIILTKQEKVEFVSTGNDSKWVTRQMGTTAEPKSEPLVRLEHSMYIKFPGANLRKFQAQQCNVTNW